MAIPTWLANSMSFSRSKKTVRPASTASAVAPQARICWMVGNPTTGTSKRMSCFGLLTFTTTSVFPLASRAARAIVSSVPSIASTATHALSEITTVCPTSIPAICRATPSPYSMSAASSSLGARCVKTPASGTNGLKNSVESTSRIPSSPKTFATAPINASVFFLGNANNNFANFQSGRIALKIFVCFTCPAITACVTPSLCSKSIVLLNSPRLTQCNLFVCASSSGAASSLIAITAISIPWLRAPSSTRNGNLPLPAISPHPELLARAIDMDSSRKLLHDAALGRLDELHELDHVSGIVKLFAHLRQRLRSIQFRPQQQSKRALQSLPSLLAKSLALQPYRINPKTLRLALRHHARKRRHILRNHRARANVRIPPDPAELMHRRQRTHRHVVFNHHVPRHSRRIRKNRVTSNHAVVSDVRIGHKQIVIADLRRPAALFRPTAHCHRLSKIISIADDQLRPFALERQILRVHSHRAERMKNIARSKLRRTLYHRVTMHDTPISQRNVRANHRERSHRDARAQLRFRRHHRLRMDRALAHFPDSLLAGSRSIILHISVASAASCPSTMPLPSILQKSPRHESTVTSSRS